MLQNSGRIRADITSGCFNIVVHIILQALALKAYSRNRLSGSLTVTGLLGSTEVTRFPISNCHSLLYRYRDKVNCWSKIANFSYPTCIHSHRLVDGDPIGISKRGLGDRILEWRGNKRWQKFDDTLTRCDTILDCDRHRRRTDGRTSQDSAVYSPRYSLHIISGRNRIEQLGKLYFPFPSPFFPVTLLSISPRPFPTLFPLPFLSLRPHVRSKPLKCFGWLGIWGNAVSSSVSSVVWGGAPAEIEFGAF